jgi:hypothetical protein
VNATDEGEMVGRAFPNPEKMKLRRVSKSIAMLLQSLIFETITERVHRDFNRLQSTSKRLQ